jgi:hypothetical protein
MLDLSSSGGASVLASRLVLRDVADDRDRAACQAAARAAGHSCAAPTQIIERFPSPGGEGQGEGERSCVGYASIGAVTVLTGWLHDDRVSAEEARDIVKQLEQIARETGAGYVIMPCTKDCRMLGHLEDIGWRRLPEYHLFLKRLSPIQHHQHD